MLERGITRRAVTNIPCLESASTYISKGKEYIKVFDRLPDVLVDFNEDTWDFSDCFTYGNNNESKLHFRPVPEAIRMELKLFAANKIDTGTRVRTTGSYVRYIAKILLIALEDRGINTIAALDAQDIVSALEKAFPKRYNIRRRALSNILDFLLFLDTQLDIVLTMDLKRLEVFFIQISDALSGYKKVKHSTEISPGKMDEIIDGLDAAMRDSHVRIETRMAAGMVLLDTQTGIRPSELTAMETDCLKQIEDEEGNIHDAIEYNCLKAALPGEEVIKQMTICTPLAKSTIEYLLELRKKFPHYMNSKFLYLDNTKSSRQGKAARPVNIYKKYISLCTSYLYDIFSRPILGIEQRNVKIRRDGKPTKEIPAYIPNLYCYRVTFACRLFAQGFPVEYINAIMSHMPDSTSDDAYILNTRLPRQIVNEIGRLFKNV